MIKTRSLTIVIVLGFLVSILFSAMFSFAEEKLTFTAYYPSPNGYYNQLNATDLTVTNHAQVGHSLGVGLRVPDAGSDITIIKPGEAASLMMMGQGGTGISNHAELILASPGIVDPDDPSLWALTHSADQNKLVYVQHSSGDLDGSTGDPIFKSVLTMNTQGNVGIGTTIPNTRLYLNDTRRDLLRLESNSANGSGIMFRNRHADMGNNQYFGMGWGGSAASARMGKLNFWYAGDDVSYYTPPIMTLYGPNRVGIKNQSPNYSLHVNGGAVFDTGTVGANGEEFIVKDSLHGSTDPIWYRPTTGQLYLGNRGAPDVGKPEVTIRDNLTVLGNLEVDGTTRGLSRNISRRTRSNSRSNDGDCDATARCPNGYVVIGGGCDFWSSEMSAKSNRPGSDDKSWYCHQWGKTFGGKVETTAHAICLRQ